MAIASQESRPSLSESWVQDTVNWLWGFRLQRFQLDILMALLNGGIYSVMLPTDHGKSTLLEMSVVLSLILDPTHPNIVVKISPTAAKQTLESCCVRLIKAATRYPWVEPKVPQSRITGLPQVGHGFFVTGADFTNVRNPSLYAASLGEADNQGRRGRTHIDDIETEREGKYIAYRERLEGRVDSMLRTIERDPQYLWAIFGTPQHGDSIMFKTVNKLRSTGDKFKIFRFPIQDPETGAPLWKEAMEKAELHRRTMSPWAWRVAYELEPTATSRLDWDALERCKDRTFPFCRNWSEFKAWLATRYENHEEALAHSSRYIGYDPSGDMEYAVASIVFIGQEWFLLQAHLEPGDVFQQIARVAQDWEAYEDPIIVIEKNAQQKAFVDLARERLPQAQVVTHQTTSIMKSEQIGIPFMLNDVAQGYAHLPYADNIGRNVAEYALTEMENYSAQSHPHLLPAIWFAWYWHRRHVTVMRLNEKVEQAAPAQARVVKIDGLYKKRAAGAWGRHRR